MTPERVLPPEGGTVRFTPLLDTNDTFEVRSTFDKLAGPKMLSMLAEQMDNTLTVNRPLETSETRREQSSSIRHPAHIANQIKSRNCKSPVFLPPEERASGQRRQRVSRPWKPRIYSCVSILKSNRETARCPR